MYNAPYLSQQPVDDFGLRFSSIKFGAKLPDNVSTSLVIPGNTPRYKAVIKTSLPVFVASNKPAVIPVSASFVSSDVELVTSDICREVTAGETLNFIATTVNTFVSVVLYSIYT